MAYKLRNIFTSLVLIGLIAAATASEAAYGSAQAGAYAAVDALSVNAALGTAQATTAQAGDAEVARAELMTASAGSSWAAGARQAASRHSPPGGIAEALAEAEDTA